MRYTYSFAIAALAVAGLSLAGCQRESSTYTKVEPAKVEHVDGINKLTLTEKAMERIGVQTAPVREGKIDGSENEQTRPFVPYSALMYVANGDTFVYTSPKPRTFVRQAVNIDYIADDVVVLNEGPPAGTEVVTVGAAELFGAEAAGGGGH